MYSERGYKHFTYWTLEEQKKAVKACGLAHSKWPTKPRCNWILEQLAETPFPIRSRDVMQELERRNICTAIPRANHKSLTLLLLQHMAAGMSPPQVVPEKEIVAPTRKALELEANLSEWNRVRNEDISPHWYNNPAVPERRSLWKLRRHVGVHA